MKLDVFLTQCYFSCGHSIRDYYYYYYYIHILNRINNDFSHCFGKMVQFPTDLLNP